VHDAPTPIELMAAAFGAYDEPEDTGVVDDPVEDQIKTATLRGRVDVTGRIVAIEPTERPIRFVDVVVDDGTGRLRCRFFGRAMIGGFELGREARVVGRLTLHLGRECVCNPGYELRRDPGSAGVASS
jgi:hypothetical protein